MVNTLFLKTDLKLPFLNGLEFSYFFRSLKLDVSLKSFDVFFYTKADDVQEKEYQISGCFKLFLNLRKYILNGI